MIGIAFRTIQKEELIERLNCRIGKGSFAPGIAPALERLAPAIADLLLPENATIEPLDIVSEELLRPDRRSCKRVRICALVAVENRERVAAAIESITSLAAKLTHVSESRHADVVIVDPEFIDYAAVAYAKIIVVARLDAYLPTLLRTEIASIMQSVFELESAKNLL